MDEMTAKELDDHAATVAGGKTVPYLAAGNLIAEVRRLAVANHISRQNLQEAWAALAMIREAIEAGNVGALPSAEHLKGPTFTHEAEAIVGAITSMVSQAEAFAVAAASQKAVAVTQARAAMLEEAINVAIAVADKIPMHQSSFDSPPEYTTSQDQAAADAIGAVVMALCAMRGAETTSH